MLPRQPKMRANGRHRKPKQCIGLNCYHASAWATMPRQNSICGMKPIALGQSKDGESMIEFGEFGRALKSLQAILEHAFEVAAELGRFANVGKRAVRPWGPSDCYNQARGWLFFFNIRI